MKIPKDFSKKFKHNKLNYNLWELKYYKTALDYIVNSEMWINEK